jgi:hypothetical protein
MKGLSVPDFDLVVDDEDVREVNRPVQVPHLVQMLNCFKERQKSVDHFFFGKLLLEMQPGPLGDFRVQGRLLFLVEKSLVEGQSGENVGVTDSHSGAASCRGEVSVSDTGRLVEKEYLIGLVFDESQGMRIECLHLVLLNILFYNL